MGYRWISVSMDIRLIEEVWVVGDGKAEKFGDNEETDEIKWGVG